MQKRGMAAALVCLAWFLVMGAASAAPDEALREGPAVLYPDLPYEGPARDDIDAYGGWLGLQGEKTGFFHIQKIGARYWFITPEGNAYFALIMRMGDQDKAVAERLKAWGFNCNCTGTERPQTADAGIPYIINMKFLHRAEGALPIPEKPGFPPWLRFPDVFDPAWPAECERYAEEKLGPVADDPWCMGYYIHNEARLDGWYGAATLTEPGSPARQAFVEVARAYYEGKPEQLVEDWKEYGVKTLDDLNTVKGEAPNISGLRKAWDAAVAEKAFSTIAAAAKKADPNHLNLGCRMMSGVPPSPEILGAMGKYCDVISMNLYSILPDRLLTQIFTILPALHIATGKPLMTSEFSYRGADTVLPNTTGAPPTVATQGDRAIGYLSYMSAVAALPFFVGAGWYTYNDDEAEVDWQKYGEDSNFGAVDALNRPYAELTQAMRLTNGSIYELAADPVQQKQCPLFWRSEPMRWDVEWDSQMLARYGRMSKPFEDPFANLLPEPRRFHETYWVHHESPNLVVNDLRFIGNAQANMIRKHEDGHELAIFGIRYFTSFPRSLWFGDACEKPEDPVALESNASILVRRVDGSGNVLRMTSVNGSYAMTDFRRMHFRANCKAPYMDLRFEHGEKTLAITTRGTLEHLGVSDIEGWKATWNGIDVAPVEFSAPNGMTVFAAPGEG